MLHKINNILKYKLLVSAILFLAVYQLSYSDNLGGGTLTGSTPVVPNSQHTYTFESGLLITGPTWVITGGSLVSSSMVLNEEGYPSYQAVVLWGSAGNGTVTFKKSFTTLASLAVAIASSGPAMPSTPTITNYCNNTRLTRENPPSGEVWYWQNISTGTDTTNAAQYVDRISGTVYFLRAYDSSTTQWSSANAISYTVTQDACASSNQNYIQTTVPQIASTDVSGLTMDQKIESVTYFDGLGRPIQSIGTQAGGNLEDIATHIEYDEFGRQVKDYLPYAVSGTGSSYKTDALSAINNFYGNSAKYENTANPYSEKIYEASPLNRILEQTAPGSDWKKGLVIDINGHSDGHSIKFYYSTNTTTDVKQYTATTVLSGDIYIPSLVLNANYTVNELYKTITKDENWKSTDGLNRTNEEFKDKQGRVILKRSYNTGVAHDTYYIYDEYGNLSYVLPPQSEPQSTIPDPTVLAELCYQYKYDNRNRLVEKKIPGKGWEEIVYNKLDLPVMTRDQNLKAQSKWLFTKYDAYGRVVYTGIKNSSNSRITFQNSINNNTSVTQYETKVSSGTGYLSTYYTSTAIPTSVSEILTINYYDNYTFDKVAGNSETSYSVTPSTNIKGLASGSKVRVLETNNWITTVSYYDDKSRPIYIYSNNAYLGTTDKVKSKLDFVGKVDETTSTHDIAGQSTITTVDTFTYDHIGRLVSQKQKINTLPEELIALNKYDELGQLENKKVGGDVASILENSTGLQTVDYNYTIRGWLKTINQDSYNDNDLFNFTIMYNDIADTTKKLYNGNISQTSWNTLSNNTTGNPISTQYTYTYDALNRITSAVDNTTNYNLDLVQYDKNGNITALKRQGHLNTGATNFGTMDDLTYSYDSGNKLMKVADVATIDQFGFKDDAVNTAADTSDDYSYDQNGNLLTDTNKGITSILYNHLNLPTEIKFDNSNTKKINYTYSADGTKLRKTVNDGGTITTLDYAGNDAIYENNTLQFIPHAEGYVTPDGNSWRYIYNYVDHLGSIRLSYSDGDGNGTISQSEIIEENNYQPFGLKMRGFNSNTNSLGNSLAQRYKFNGKEFDDSFNETLNTYDFGARNYAPALGRWMNLDPLAEQMRRHSPYNYAFDNPIYFIDPDGMAPIEFDESEDIKNIVSYRPPVHASTVVDDTGKIIDYKDDGDDNIYLNTRSEENIIGKEKSNRTYEVGQRIYRDEVTVSKDKLPKHFWNLIYVAEIMDNDPPQLIHPRDIIKISLFELLFGAKALIIYGKNANQIHHTFRHILKAGLTRKAVEKAVAKSVNKNLKNIKPGKSFNKTITVGRQKITYTAHKLPTGEINVGRIVIPK